MSGFQSNFYPRVRLELSTHKKNLWVTKVTMVPYAGKMAEKDYRPAQLSEDGYCISMC